MRTCIVAIPTKDEAERLPACLSALAAQTDLSGRSLDSGAFGVAIFANNCVDESAEVARSMAPGLPFPLRVFEASLLPPTRAALVARPWIWRRRGFWSEVSTTA